MLVNANVDIAEPVPTVFDMIENEEPKQAKRAFYEECFSLGLCYFKFQTSTGKQSSLLSSRAELMTCFDLLSLVSAILHTNANFTRRFLPIAKR